MKAIAGEICGFRAEQVTTSSGREHRDRRWRTSDGELDLNEGDVVAFPRADDGLHQVRNHTDAPVRVLMLSTLVAPDLVRYPDSGKFAARDVNGEGVLLSRPGADPRLLGRRELGAV